MPSSPDPQSYKFKGFTLELWADQGDKDLLLCTRYKPRGANHADDAGHRQIIRIIRSYLASYGIKMEETVVDGNESETSLPSAEHSGHALRYAEKILKRAMEMEKKEPLSEVANQLLAEAEQRQKERVSRIQDTETYRREIGKALRLFAPVEKFQHGEVSALEAKLTQIAQSLHDRNPTRESIAEQVIKAIQETWGGERLSQFGLGRSGPRFDTIFCQPDMPLDKIKEIVAREVGNSQSPGTPNQGVADAETIAFRGKEFVARLTDAIAGTVTARSGSSSGLIR